ncbi:hypothetical protein GGR56DRAFT_47541 [Xylariaceae sp. FL0804]|nr:hypothetical protein GGR56DRAFT_47541 [Xylariaceae sp. FL0804]
MSRTAAMARPGSVCQICHLISSRSLQPARRTIATRLATRQQAPSGRSTSVPGRWGRWERRWLSSPSPPPRRTQEATERELASITNMMTFLEKAGSKVLDGNRIPPEADAIAALRACRVVADYVMDDSVQPQVAQMANELKSTASNLLSLEDSAEKRDKAGSLKSSKASDTSTFEPFRQMVDTISELAYTILSHRTVSITPNLLAHYVVVQNRLGRPETLPMAFQLYATKPTPRQGAAGSISFTSRNPAKIENAIDARIIEKALGTAIEARNLDAAVGIVENGYKAKAYGRHKLLRRGLLPLGTFAATPAAAWILATKFADFQQAMDGETATKVAFTGIIAYVGFTAMLGMVAVTTANDQMKRVTWAPGTPLRSRWFREDERAALDRIACAWGFQETWRQGEEEGPDWDVLREYLGQQGMLLDRTELMEGMD